MQMTLSELRAGVESLNKPYQQVADRLSMEAPEANARYREVSGIWSEAFSQDYDFLTAYEESVLPDEESIKSHNEVIEALGTALSQSDSRNIVLFSGYLVNTLRKYVAAVVQKAWNKSTEDDHQGLREEGRKARDDYRKALLLQSRIDNAELSQQLWAALSHSKQVVQQLEELATTAQTAAGFVSGAKLTDRFRELSKDHFTAAVVFRCLTVVAVAVGIVGTFVLGFVPGVSHGGTTTTGDAILRISLLGAVLGLATYFGRQAAYHRDLGTWARTIKEQLLTFDGYVEPLTDDGLRNQLRAAFASRVFGSSPESKEDAGVSLSSSVVGELLANIAKNGAK